MRFDAGALDAGFWCFWYSWQRSDRPCGSSGPPQVLFPLRTFDPLGLRGPAALSFCCFSPFLFLFFGGVGGPAVAGLPGPGEFPGDSKESEETKESDVIDTRPRSAGLGEIR